MNLHRTYFEDIDQGPSTRREREEAAVVRLVERVFGAGARRVHDPLGAPVIALPDGTVCKEYVSLSHSRRTAALAVSTRRIGIDIEEERPQLDRVAARVLSDDELKHYLPLPHGLLRAWTLKEALYKASRALTGAEIDFARQLHLPTPGDATARVCDASGRIVAEFDTSAELRPDGQMVAVVTCRDAGERSL